MSSETPAPETVDGGLSIEKPYELGEEILLEGGIEGEVVQMNWRSTHLRNGANDIVIIPNSAIAKMRIQNHSAGSKRKRIICKWIKRSGKMKRRQVRIAKRSQRRELPRTTGS